MWCFGKFLEAPFVCLAACSEPKNNQKACQKDVRNGCNTKLKQGDWYINAEEAVNYGFADGVLGDRKHPDIKSVKDISSWIF